jgi:hypothetical protein
MTKGGEHNKKLRHAYKGKKSKGKQKGEVI